eukprot:TRINITY_DN6959_c0_g1_i2.p1 TRINITY_DN6959_c0_g1~~TRINITY_DN6959_c0_g1_i2.p1  ORF type:complete len:205 (+),score=46.99 TRINITY_DN6959_c0_g1_i2:89-703(+)
MIRRPPRSTLSSSSAASDVYKRQGINAEYGRQGSVGWRVEMPRRTTAEIDEGLHSLYKELDSHGNGDLDTEQVQKYLRRVHTGSVAKELLEPVIQSFIEQLDKDHNGKISFEEFKNTLDTKILPQREEAENFELFSHFIKGSVASYITAADLHETMAKYRGDNETQVSLEDCREMLKQASTDGSEDRLTYEDFVRIKETLSLFR